MNINSFYYKCYKNIFSSKVFFKYYDSTKKYSDLKIFYAKFLKIIKNKERLKVVTLSDKTFEMYASIASIFFSNNIWIPVSANLPTKRLIKIFEISKPNILIVNKKSTLLKIKLFSNHLKKNKIRVITYEQINATNHYEKKIVKKEIREGQLSMIYFTSGSTGSPKGVCITYNSFISCFDSYKKIVYKDEKNLVFGDYHDSSFVISLNIFIPCLYYGGIISPSQNLIENLDPSKHIQDNGVNVLITVPSTINRISSVKNNNRLKFNIKAMIMCGEPFSIKLAKYIFRYVEPKNLYNFYGATEVSSWIFSHKCKKSDVKNLLSQQFMPVGMPLSKTKIKILNDELLVAGPMLSDGYLEKYQNEEAFLKIKGVRWYKTSDQIILYDKKYFIKGRIDKVVKIQGYRVDLNDIENNLRKINVVEDVIVYLKKKFNSQILLCAIKSKNLKKEDYIIKKLSEKLPNYMIPKKVRIYKNFPLNRSGKTDRKKIMI